MSPPCKLEHVQCPSGAVLVVKANGRISSWNPAAEQLLWAEDDPLPEPGELAELAATSPWLVTAWRGLLADPAAGSVEVSGDFRGLSLRGSLQVLAPCRDEAPDILVSLAADASGKITRPAGNRIKAVIDSLPDATCIIDAESHRIESANQAFCQEFAMAGDPIGRACHEVMFRHQHPCDKASVDCSVRETVRLGYGSTCDHLCIDSEGGQQLYEMTTVPLTPGRIGAGKVVCMLRNVTDRGHNRESLQQLASYDGLTGLPGRDMFLQRLGEDIQSANQRQGLVGVMLIDLDRFKRINDTIGRQVGDRLMQQVAERLQGCLRRCDLVARIGGDEFGILLPALADEAEVPQVAERILGLFAEVFDIAGQEIYCTASLGVALFPVDGQEGEDLLKNAEFAIGQARKRGYGFWQRFSLETSAAAVEKLVIETSLRYALEREEMFLCYQPQVDARSGRLTGCEALIRWQHPFMGVVSPLKFISTAEEIGLIIDIGDWTLETACRQLRAWQEAGFAPIRVGINMSVRQLRDPGFVGRVASIIEQSGIDPGLIELELTESMLMREADGAVKTLAQLKQIGVELAIDDFGTGYSSLSYLRNFPVDRIKIDRSFVKDIGTPADDGTIAKVIISIARTLNLSVIAEGVEDRAQYEFLLQEGCEEIQGYYFGRPLTVEDFTLRLEQDSAVGNVGLQARGALA